MLLLRLCALILAVLVPVSRGQAAPYYGLPLGSIFYSADSTSGEVYASDLRTLTVVNFRHSAQPGCTTFMAGPPKQGENLDVAPSKQGVMLAVKYRKQTRAKRQAPDANFVPQIAALNPSEELPEDLEETLDEPVVLGGDSNTTKTFPPLGPRLFTRGSTTEGPSTTATVRSPGTGGIHWSSEPGPASQPAFERGVPVERPRQEAAQRQNQGSATAQAGGGIQWIDHTPPPKVPRYRIDDNFVPRRGDAQPQTAAPVVGSGIHWGDASAPAPSRIQLGGSAPKSSFFGPLPRYPTEYFGGINIPDELEGKGPGFDSPDQPQPQFVQNGPDIYTGEGVTLQFGAPAATRSPNVVQFGGSAPSSRGFGAPSPRLPPSAPASPSAPAPREEVRSDGSVLYRFGGPRGETTTGSPSLTGSQAVASNPQEPSAGEGGNEPLFYVVEDRRRPTPSVTETPPTQAPSAPEGREWTVVEERPRRPAPPPPPPAQLVQLKVPNQAVYRDSPLYVAIPDDRRAHFLPIIATTAAVPAKPVEVEVPEADRNRLTNDKANPLWVPLPDDRKALFVRTGEFPDIPTEPTTTTLAPTSPTTKENSLFVPVPDRKALFVRTGEFPAIPTDQALKPIQASTTTTPKAQENPLFVPVADRKALFNPPRENQTEQPITTTRPTTQQQPTTVTVSSQTHALWAPIPDDRRAHFIDLPALVAPAVAQQGQQSQQGQQGTAEERVATPDFSVFTTPILPSASSGNFYVLPDIRGEDITIVLPPQYELSDFQWFGIFDHCKKQRTAHVNIRGVQPPQEAIIDGVKGWQHDVASEKINVINCNTLLLKNFTYSGAGKTESYIYIGNGDFPHGIIQKARAYVVGSIAERPLKNYNSEDVLVRLPTGWKTFEMSWLSIYNPKDNVSYGHAIIPPVVVPPCED